MSGDSKGPQRTVEPNPSRPMIKKMKTGSLKKVPSTITETETTQHIVSGILSNHFGFSAETSLQEGLLSLFEDSTGDLHMSDLFIKARKKSGKTLGALLFLAHRLIREDKLHTCPNTHRDTKPKENPLARRTLIFVPNAERVNEVRAFIEVINRGLESLNLALKHRICSREASKAHDADSDQDIDVLVTTPAVFLLHTHKSDEGRRDALAKVRSIIFDSADEILSSMSIRKVISDISQVQAQKEALGEDIQIVILCTYFTENVRRLKELLRSPLNITLEENFDGEGADAEGHEHETIPLDTQDSEAAVAKSNQEISPHPTDSQRIETRVSRGHYTIVKDEAERFTWLYAKLQKALNNAARVLIIVPDVVNCYKLQLFMQALSVKVLLYHELLATTNRTNARKDFLKNGFGALIASSGALRQIMSSNANNACKSDVRLFWGTHSCVHFCIGKESSEEFIEFYNKIEHFLSAVPARYISQAEVETITLFSDREDTGILSELDYALTNKRKVSPGAGEVEGYNADDNLYRGITEGEVKAYQYRCNDIFFTHCSKKRVKSETAKMVSKEIREIQEAPTNAVKRKFRKKRQRS